MIRFNTLVFNQEYANERLWYSDGCLGVGLNAVSHLSYAKFVMKHGLSILYFIEINFGLSIIMHTFIIARNL